ncbi:MAG: primosomal protein N' [Chloroflexota bacterium]
MTSLRSPRPRYVKVAVNAGRATYMTFSYAVPPGREVVAGDVVHVPFGKRSLQGIVVEGPFDTPGYDPDAIRPLDPPVEGAPSVSPDRLALAEWVREYYLSPAWEAFALVLPPGAGERPVTAVARGEGEPVALSERQAAIYDALREEPVDVDDLRTRLAEVVPARSFEAALNVLLRRGLAVLRYRLDRPRGRARVVEVVRLVVSPSRARAFSEGIAGRRSSRRARAIRAALDAGGSLPYDRAVREARGAPAVETLIEDGTFVRDGEAVRLAIAPQAAERLLRVLSRGLVEQAAAAVLDRLAALGEAGDRPELPVRGLPAEAGRETATAIDRLVEVGLLTRAEVLDRRDPLSALQVVVRPAVELVPEQRAASARIRAAIDAREGQGMLLWGVTGSGKTEVYLDALRHTIERGRRALVLVPEIALTPQTVRRFAERFPGRVGVLHSGLSLGEAYDQWHAIAEGRFDVVIGSRSAVFAPQPDLGLIVIDEAHEWTYKQHDPAPRYDARTVALELGRRAGAAVVFGTATPDAESWFAAAEGRLERIDLPRRIRAVEDPQSGRVRLWPVSDLPEVEVVDMHGVNRLFSPRLVEALGEVLDRDEQAILFLNRRGFAGYLLCARGHSPTCTSCDVSMSLHEDGRLVCHQCGRSRRLPPACQQDRCGLPLRPLRAGTQQVETEVRRHFPTARVLRWDRDTARTREQHEAIIGAFQRQHADVLVGTQMVAKGLDLPLVTLVGVVLADYSLREGDFRSRERTFQLLVQVAGRAGRAQRDGRVIVQTLRPEEDAVAFAAAHDVDGFFERELAWRSERGYPPFKRMVRLLFQHTNEAYAAEEARRMALELRTLAVDRPGVEVTGPTPPQVARSRGRHRWSILVRGDAPADLVRDLDDLPPGWVVDVDPLVVN